MYRFQRTCFQHGSLKNRGHHWEVLGLVPVDDNVEGSPLKIVRHQYQKRSVDALGTKFFKEVLMLHPVEGTRVVESDEENVLAGILGALAILGRRGERSPRGVH